MKHINSLWIYFVLLLMLSYITNSLETNSELIMNIKSSTRNQNSNITKAQVLSKPIIKPISKPNSKAIQKVIQKPSQKNIKVAINPPQPLKKVEFSDDDARLYIKFAKLVQCAKNPVKKTCSKCFKPGISDWKMFYYKQRNFHGTVDYQVTMHFSDIEDILVVSFGGPSISSAYKYYSEFYSKPVKWIKIRALRFRVEMEFIDIYFKGFRKELTTKIVKFLSHKERKDFKVIFTGWSIGGSLSLLAALDLKVRRMITAQNNLTVFTYGGLRVGDNIFVDEVNKNMKVWRIYKESDYIPRMPNCEYMEHTKRWSCDKSPKTVQIFTLPVKVLLNTKYKNRNKRMRAKRRNFHVAKVGKKSTNRNSVKNIQQDLGPPIVTMVQQVKIQKEKQNTFMNTYIAPLKKYNPLEKISKHLFKKGSLKNPINSPIELKPINNKAVMPTFIYLFYTPNIGSQIYYKDDSSEFRICKYPARKGTTHKISKCEEIIDMPAKEINMKIHEEYLGINFMDCKKII